MPTTSSVKGGITGLNKVLRKLPKEANDELRAASADIARDVAADARNRAERLGGVARHVAPSIKDMRDRVPKIRLGGSGYPMAFGAEYGGQRRPTTRQFQPFRGSGQGAGYFLWRTVHDQNARINDRYSEALLKALKAL